MEASGLSELGVNGFMLCLEVTKSVELQGSALVPALFDITILKKWLCSVPKFSEHTRME